MNGTVDDVLNSERAAVLALSLLQREGGLSAAAVWSRLGETWQRLASFGAADALPVADALEHGRLPGPDGGALPIRIGERSLGWLIWRGKAPQSVDEIAALLSGHLQSAVLQAEQAAARVSNETMLEISLLAGESPSLERLLPRLHRLMARLMDASNFYIALLDDDGACLHFPFYVDSRVEPPPAERMFPLDGQDGSLTAWLIRGGKPVALTRERILEVCRDAGLERPIDLPLCWMGAPLVSVGGNLIGAVVLQQYENQPPLTSAEQLMFMFAARHIGFALDRVRYRGQLERQVWLRTSELEGANARLRAEVASRKRAEKFQDVLFRIAELSNTSLSLEAFLSGLHRLLGEMVAARNCLVALYDMINDRISFPYCADEYAVQIKPRKPGKGYIEQVLHSGRPLLVDPYSHLANQEQEESGAQPKSWLGVPLYCGHELLGVLAVQSYESEVVYTFRDQEVLEFVANNIGAALARVRALESLQKAYAELEQRVRERTSELDAVNAQLEFDSLHDPLTKLPNRNYFAKTMRRAWDAYVSGKGDRFAVVFIDLDRFKLVNDTLGHLAGDHLLFEAGARIRSCLRHYDFLARLGGDEFAVLMFGMEAAEECEIIARRIVGEFERPVILAGREVFSTASVGVVLADREHYRKADDLLRDADHAMYCTKQQGRQGYTLFSHQLRIDQADQLALETELRRALEEESQLVPYYQPFIEAETGKLAGFESLVRWQHPQRGLISPGVFLPIAEESGLITRLDRYMLNAACAQLQAWRAEGQVGEHISLHINLSSANFHDPDLVGWIGERIAYYQLPPAMLHLEITESALIDQPETAATVMQALHALGVKLALDDFGTGYSALSYLHRYKFDVLKIDQSFVFELEHKEESAAIVRAILALASALGLDVVAEGVETASQLAILREMRCSKLQGFYFAAPAPGWNIDWERLARFERDIRSVA
ncbi:EAL domain-containing protein [Chromobacterium sp. IIBBL 290-4]|uniref:sensor domain-containing phosphodiesterase n=1 Tax=Chromobacterium sp. IIBBL 290-4 TaxID=2953890 RepID=UPI0020B7D178|nr:EAL domain-containing protein [Chromobacterium sp. IIBBL 290-4]UTH75600.1 EAL domain-containing protein [Chromobacterium sp. IIBBL 290-4]